MILVLLWYCLLRQGWNSYKCVGTCRSHTSWQNSQIHTVSVTHLWDDQYSKTIEETSLHCTPMFNSQLLQSRIFTMIFLFDSVRSRIYLWIWMSLITLASSATTCSRLYFTAINGFHRIENIFLKWKKIQINVCNCTTSQHERLVLSHHQLMMQIMFFQKIIHCLWCFFLEKLPRLLDGQQQDVAEFIQAVLSLSCET